MLYCKILYLILLLLIYIYILEGMTQTAQLTHELRSEYKLARTEQVLETSWEMWEIARLGNMLLDQNIAATGLGGSFRQQQLPL